jgi:NAD(P)-dependent dehydrogenase (short-subunit alcohol dehydrogenase family)
MANWTTHDIPPQSGRRAVITGATGGLGYETALALAAAGAEVVLTGRNETKGKAALAAIRATQPRASISYQHLDLASLASVREFVERFASEHETLDLLINNAGVMTPPARKETADGFELQFGTNYLSHFALTAQLLPLLRKADRPRVVNLSSIAHKLRAAIHFDDLQWTRRYDPWMAYAQSKLAMLMFALELQRRSDANGWGLLSNAAHPGFARTDLIANGPGERSLANLVGRWTIQPLMSQSAAAGALPTLFAATAPEARPGGYYGPTGLFETKGPAGVAAIAPRAQDEAVATRLWEVSEELTKVRWPSTEPERVS